MAQKFTQTIRQPRVTFSQLSPETLTRGRAVYTTERVTNQKVKNNIDKEMVVAMEYRHIIFFLNTHTNVGEIFNKLSRTADTRRRHQGGQHQYNFFNAT